MKPTKILMIAACGPFGKTLLSALREIHGREQVIAADRFLPGKQEGPYRQLNLQSLGELATLVKEEQITQIYLAPDLFPSAAELNNPSAWELNVNSLLHVLRVAAAQRLDKIFWPGSMTVFGPASPKHFCPQETLIHPDTVHGIIKRTCEYWCNHYFEEHGVDARSIRFPILVSGATPSGNALADYTVDMIRKALEKKSYTSFLKKDTCLPMMYLPDAIRATIELMNCPKERVEIRTAYNTTGMSFSPGDLETAIRQHIQELCVSYQPDHRQAAAERWPVSIDDLAARRDWNWEPLYNLKAMVSEVLIELRQQKTARAEIPHPSFLEDKYAFTR